MALTKSQMTDLGRPAPAFDLPASNPTVDDFGGDTRALRDYDDAEVLVVVFTCNHCPYAQHVEEALVKAAHDYEERGVQFVAICSNDAESHPEDGFDHMAERARQRGFPFPYLRDASQEVARAYEAVCTPDFFVYDAGRTLAYRGRFDETRPGQGAATGRDLRRALDELLDEGRVAMEQPPSMGCNIKWKEGR